MMKSLAPTKSFIILLFLSIIALAIIILISRNIRKTPPQAPLPLQEPSALFKKAETWSQITQNDLNFIYYQIHAHHPGPVNTEDPKFNQEFTNAYNKAQAKLASVNNKNDYWTVLEEFIRSFNDTHLRIFRNDKNYEQALEKLSKEHLYVQEVGQDIAWIRIPTFDLNQKQQEELEQVKKILPSLRNKKTIIFDIHGNGGGNSAFGSQLIAALFGQNYADQQKEKLWESVYVDYRVSPENLSHWKKLAEISATWIGVYNLMAEALKNGIPLIRTPEPDKEIPNDQKVSKKYTHTVTAKIFVLIDQKCVSASLDFIDELKALDYPITLIGKTTSADSLYMDVRSINLPSGYGTLIIPLKVYRGRKRGHNVPYQPDIIYPGNLEDSARVINFIRTTLL